MKRSLLAIGALFIGAASFAQVDTLTTHFTGTPTIYGIDQALPIDSGYVAGNNIYGDLAKLQLFDATYGVTSGGQITGVLLAVPIKVSNGGSFQVGIWADNAGTPASLISPLGIASVTLASVDTTTAGYHVANGTVIYNVAAMFATPITIPTGNKFWAGVILPATSGNAISLLTTTDGDFTAASTHTGEVQASGTYYSFNDGTNATWGLDVALSIYPVVNLVAGINENVIEAAVYPNPATDVLNIKAKEGIASVRVLTMDGKVVATSATTSVSVAGLTAGIYMYEAVTVSGKVARGNFAKN